jgi:ABC-2 type transport system ATP-binding protein
MVVTPRMAPIGDDGQRSHPVNAVELRNVTKSFAGHVAVDDLSLDVPAGSVYGFIGPNGAGKTTTLRMIMNIIYADRGSIRVLGEEQHEAYTDRVGYLPEERGLYKKMKVRDLLRFYGELKSNHGVKNEVEHWLKRLGLAEWGGKKIETLSKGMSQKVQFIAAVVCRPQLLILDEPFSGLDPVNADALRDAVLELRSAGTTIVFSTHDMNVAGQMCDFIFMIFKGRKVLDGTLTAIQDRFASDTIHVRIEGDPAILRQIPGVDHVNDHGQFQDLHTSIGTDPQQVLAAIMARARIRQFELARPSLHEVFVRIAGPEGRQVTHA